jgi:nitric oxide reductase activation protein
MYGHAGEEAVSESLRIAQRQLDQRQEPTKVIIYLHDGLPVDETPGEVAATVQRVRASGINVLGVFAGDQRDIGNLQAIFGNEDTLGVADMKKLPDRLGMILRRYWNS